MTSGSNVVHLWERRKREIAVQEERTRRALEVAEFEAKRLAELRRR